MFKALSSEEKEPYEEMARKDKERYKKEMADYVPPSDDDDDDDSGDNKKSKKKKKDPNAPKRGKSSFMFFSSEWRSKIKEENPDATFGELGKLVGAKFKSLSAEEKKPYEDMAEKDKARYAKEMAAYKQKSVEEEEEDDDDDGVDDSDDGSDDSDSDSDSDSD